MKAILYFVIFWDVKQCTLVDKYRSFGGSLHHQGTNVSGSAKSIGRGGVVEAIINLRTP
jgi:hypothetical protein